MYILKIVLTFFSLITFVNIYSQDTIRVTKIKTELDYDYITEKETENINERDTSIYSAIKFENGSFKNELISSTNNSTPFFYNKSTIIDSSKFYCKYIRENIYSTTYIFETFYINNQSLKTIKDIDSNILLIASSISKRKINNVEKVTIFDYRNKIEAVTTFQCKKIIFGLLEIKKWHEFSSKNQKFNLDQKSYKIVNRQFHLNTNEKWKERTVIRYKNDKIIWEKSRDFNDDYKNTYKYDFLERKKTKVVNNKFFGFNFDVKQYKYDKLGRLIEEIHSYYNNSSSYKYIYIYD